MQAAVPSTSAQSSTTCITTGCSTNTTTSSTTGTKNNSGKKEVPKQLKSLIQNAMEDPSLVPTIFAQLASSKASFVNIENELGGMTLEEVQQSLQTIISRPGSPVTQKRFVSDAPNLESLVKCEIQSYFKISYDRADSLFKQLKKEMVMGDSTITFEVAQEFFQRKLKQISFGVCFPLRTSCQRSNEMKALKNQLATRSCVNVSGGRGSGKTEFVWQFVELHGKKMYYDRVLWLDASSNTVIETSIKRIGEKCGLKVDGIPSTLLLEYFLLDYFYNLKTLFVFDNCHVDDGVEGELQRKILECIVKIMKKECVGYRAVDVIVITNDPVPSLGISSVRLCSLPKAECMKMLQTYVDPVDKDDERSLEVLAEMVDCYPLGLSLANTLLKKQFVRFNYFEKTADKRKYISTLLKNLKQVDKKYESALNEFCTMGQKTSYVLINLLLDRLQEEPDGKRAIAMLKVFAFININNIEAKVFLPLFRQYEPSFNTKRVERRAELSIISTIKLLRSYRFIGSENFFLSIQPMVQKLLRVKFLSELDVAGQKQLLSNVLKLVLWEELPDVRSGFYDTSLLTVVSSIDKSKFGSLVFQRQHLTALYRDLSRYPDLMNLYGPFFDEYRLKVMLKATNDGNMMVLYQMFSSNLVSNTIRKRMIEFSLEYLVKECQNKILILLMDKGLIDIQCNTGLVESVMYCATKCNNSEILSYLKKKGIFLMNQDATENMSSPVIKCLMSCL